jgi:hypothetical protein
VWYQKLATGKAAPQWEYLLDTSDGEFPPTPWKSDVTSKQAKLTAQAGFTYCFAVIATGAGKVSPHADVCTAMPHKAKELGRLPNAPWQVKSAGGYYGGGYLRWNGTNSPGGGEKKNLWAALTGKVDHFPGPKCTGVIPNTSFCPPKLKHYPDLIPNRPPPYCGPAYDHPACVESATWPSTPRVKRIVLVATKCASCGRVVVTVEGSALKIGQPLSLEPQKWVKVINLKAPKMKRQQLITLKLYPDPFAYTGLDPSAFQGWLLRIYPHEGHPRIEGLALASGR